MRRRFRIKKDDLEAYGYTARCPGWKKAEEPLSGKSVDKETDKEKEKAWEQGGEKKKRMS